MEEPTKAPNVQDIKTNQKSISQVLIKYPAGTIATSDGNGKKLDSKTIIQKIPIYHQSQTIHTIKSTTACNIK
ncbi:MAG: hypothetical protein LBU14_00370 [Candidatus Peribacteria bacterium]|jgi:hypothetical protein|nr:hypothetical protein [Candidatus Peribacteria bacterium]